MCFDGRLRFVTMPMAGWAQVPQQLRFIEITIFYGVVNVAVPLRDTTILAAILGTLYYEAGDLGRRAD